ncbi:very long chain fatty acid elongase 5-like [Dysidea avara]|uniref:very long chain fatty acid elongase 5-like n=1 Tax=Dysidea avara TaxID=196820 RepID=UPI00331BAB25
MTFTTSEVIYTLITARSVPILIPYLIIVLLARPLTQLFNPFSLRTPLLLHNILCVLLSTYTAVQGIRGIMDSPGIYHTAKGSPLLRHAFLVYWISKIIELMDTMFMILRHKIKQMSFLHVFHHASILILADNGYFLVPWPPIGLLMMLNSIVHIFMYTYYGLRAVQPLNEISWKRRITQLQMAQFMFGLVFCFIGYLYHDFCVYSMLYGGGLLILFSNYYYHAFIRKKSVEKQK